MADEDLRGAFRSLHASALALAQEALGRPRPGSGGRAGTPWLLLAAPALVVVAGLAWGAELLAR